MKNKFTIEKDYNITINCEGLDINEAEVDFCIIQEGFSLSIPLRNVKENVFRLRLPAQFKNIITKKSNIKYTINVKKDNLIFEVMKESFDLEYFVLKNIKIEDDNSNIKENIEIEIITEKAATSTLDSIVDEIERESENNTSISNETKVEIDHVSSKEQELRDILLNSIKRKPDTTPAFRKLKDLMKK